MAEALERGLDTAVTERDKSLNNLFESLNLILSTTELDQKSDLTSNNIIGMVRSINFAQELNRTYRIDIRTVILGIIQEILAKTISRDRKGRLEIIEIVRAIRAELEQIPGEQGIGNRFIYGVK